MMKRWLIRGVFLLPLLLCVVGWGWSYCERGVLCYQTSWHFFSAESTHGILYLSHTSEAVFLEEGWTYDHGTFLNSSLATTFDEYGTHFSGFALHLDSGWKFVGIPYYFFVFLLCLALFFVWRKTRLKVNPVTAFPVETSGGRP